MKLQSISILLLFTVFAVAGCPATPPPVNPPGDPVPYQPGEPGPAGPTDDNPIDEAAKDQPRCSADSDCGEGSICEGQGCGPNMGVCSAKNRRCTRDLRTYCSCDGKTFQSSGSCPGKRFAYRGECTAKRPDGASCSAGADCSSGTCEGQGCDGETGTCMARDRRCTLDLRDYCGCDGASFQASGSCPGRVYKSRGSCK